MLTSTPLSRSITRLQTYANFLGVVIGIGFFTLFFGGDQFLGSPIILGLIIMSPLLFCLAFTWAFFLSTPLGIRAGGAYLHISRTFRNHFLGFIPVWLKLISFVLVQGYIALALARYIFLILDVDSGELTPGSVNLLATTIILFFFIVNFLGITPIVFIQTFLVILLLGLLFVLGIIGIFSLDTMSIETVFQNSSDGLIGVFPILIFGFIGFEAIAQTAAETQNSRKVIPKTIIIGLGIVLFLFLFLSFVILSVSKQLSLTNATLLQIDDLLLLIAADSFLPGAGKYIVIVAAIAALSTTLNITMLVPSRIMLSLSNDRLVPEIFGRVNNAFRVPDFGLMLSTFFGIIGLWAIESGVALNLIIFSMIFLYIVHGTASMLLPFINKKLFNSAKLKINRYIITTMGAIITIAMSYFLVLAIMRIISLELGSQFWLLLLGFIGLGGFIFIRSYLRNRKEKFDYHKSLDVFYLSKDL